VDVTAGQLIPVAIITAGNLKFFPDANESGSPYATFTFQVQDDGGTANGGVDLDQSANTITVNVTAVNDEPAGADNTVTTNEDTAHTFTAAQFGFTDPNDTPADGFAKVKITTLPTDGSLTFQTNAVVAGAEINVADLADLVFRPDANENGTGYATFTFQVRDDGGTANGGVDLDQSANTFTINVTPVNDAPAGTNGSTTILEDGSHAFDHQILTFRTLFPHLKSGGIYACEDLCTSYWEPEFGGGVRKPGTGIEFFKEERANTQVAF